MKQGKNRRMREFLLTLPTPRGWNFGTYTRGLAQLLHLFEPHASLLRHG